MIFRLGYVAMTLNLENCSPSGTVTLSNLNKLSDEKSKISRLKKVAIKNLENTLRILRYNKAYNIKVYRFTSKLVPLATHPVTESWNYVEDLKTYFKEIGDFVKENDFRVSAHPDHYTLINSNFPEVIDSSLKDLDYHVKIFEAMGLEDYKYKLVMHIGGLYKNKTESILRFKENFVKMPERIKRRIILENDDKLYTAKDVLAICKDLKVPMVVDIHHHNCVNSGENILDLIPQIFDTWTGEDFNPKIHFSSPKSPSSFRSHADEIDFEEFLSFLESVKTLNRDFDIMLEAKNKDIALLNLSGKLENVEGIKKINESEFELL